MHFLELVLFRFLLGRILLTIHQHDFQPLVLEYCFSIQRFSVPRDKDHTGADFLFSGIVQQQLSQLAGDQDRPDLGFAIHDNFAVAHSLHRKKFQFRHPNPGAANGLHHKAKLLILFRCFQKPLILGLGQLFFFRTVDASL